MINSNKFFKTFNCFFFRNAYKKTKIKKYQNELFPDSLFK